MSGISFALAGEEIGRGAGNKALSEELQYWQQMLDHKREKEINREAKKWKWRGGPHKLSTHWFGYLLNIFYLLFVLNILGIFQSLWSMLTHPSCMRRVITAGNAPFTPAGGSWGSRSTAGPLSGIKPSTGENLCCRCFQSVTVAEKVKEVRFPEVWLCCECDHSSASHTHTHTSCIPESTMNKVYGLVGGVLSVWTSSSLHNIIWALAAVERLFCEGLSFCTIALVIIYQYTEIHMMTCYIPLCKPLIWFMTYTVHSLWLVLSHLLNRNICSLCLSSTKSILTTRRQTNIKFALIWPTSLSSYVLCFVPEHSKS